MVKNISIIVVLYNSFNQLIYQLIKFINVSGGDEYFAAQFWGISPRAITGPLTIFYGVVLFLLLFQIYGWKERAKYLFAMLLAQSIGPILGFLDSIIRQQAILDNSLVNSIFGFSLPVLVLDFIIIIAFLLLLKNIRGISLTG